MHLILPLADMFWNKAPFRRVMRGKQRLGKPRFWELPSLILSSVYAPRAS